MTDRTGCVTPPVEKRFSAEVIVSMRSSIVSTLLTSSSVSRRKRIRSPRKVRLKADTTDGFANRVRMDCDERVDIGRVPAAHDDGDRDAARAAGIEHEAIARAQTVDRELEPAEAIAFVGIGAGEIPDDFRRVAVEDGRQMRDERVEVLGVGRAVRELDVEVAGFL